MTDANPFAAMMKSGQDMARSMGPAWETMNPDGSGALWPTMPKEVMETWFGKTLNPEGLDPKTRLLIILAGLTIMGAQAEAQLRLTVRHAIEAGATPQEVAEAIALAGVFGGLPAMTRAMELATGAMDEGKTA